MLSFSMASIFLVVTGSLYSAHLVELMLLSLVSYNKYLVFWRFLHSWNPQIAFFLQKLHFSQQCFLNQKPGRVLQAGTVHCFPAVCEHYTPWNQQKISHLATKIRILCEQGFCLSF